MHGTRVANKSKRHAAKQDCDADHNDLKNKMYEEIAYNIMTKPELVGLSKPSLVI